MIFFVDHARIPHLNSRFKTYDLTRELPNTSVAQLHVNKTAESGHHKYPLVSYRRNIVDKVSSCSSMSLERYLVVAPNGVLVSAYFMNETDSDARLRANCGREVPVHKAILASASPMFRMIFEMKEEPKPIVTMDMSYEAIVETMRYIYLAVVNYGCKAGIIEELIEAAETLHMPKFRSVLEEALIERSFNHMTL